MNIGRRDWLKAAGAGLSSGFLIPDLWKSMELNYLKSQNVAPASKLIRLSSNENPYGPSQKVRDAMSNHFDLVCRYPWSYHDTLIELISQKHSVTPDHIVLCAGSNEGLRMTALAYCREGTNVVAPFPTYEALMTYASHLGCKINRVPLTQDLRIDLAAMNNAIDEQTSLVFMCNPNNPTGDLLPAQDFVDFCRQTCKKTLLFSDEAYAEYISDSSYPSMIELVKQGHLVVVSKTFSKVYGLAGIRAGYLVTRPDLAQEIRKYSMASMNILAVYAAMAALDDHTFFKFSLNKNREVLEMMYHDFDKKGLLYVKSQANFVFVKTGMKNEMFRKKMLENGILTGRDFPPLEDWSRISCGTVEEAELFLKVFNTSF